ncbi:hypothetical protein Hypma_001960 [Hypsizygus marmoreus]|uniref:F-box domain-containing protein n=1 Tax=Hypsizygus marmoreus TaxID=39966 RepID=A0A369J5T3_HYPMA|nr:hypothetical protein Hypma_001960 [Hypsizygus marmoreus]
MAATRRALEIPEILHVIFSSLGAQHTYTPEDYENPPPFSFEFTFDPENQVTLARASRCCRKFCSPALDALWRAMDSIVPLFSLVGLVRRPDDDVYAIETGFQSSQWVRLESYASRIRHLSCKDAPTIQNFVVVRIAQHMRGRCLLPSLKSLSHPFTTYTILLISPHLRHISILNNEEDLDIPDIPQGIDFLMTLKSEVPLLQDFVTSVSWTPQQGLPAVLSTFHHLHSLEINDASSLDRSGLTHVFTLPSLIYLELQLGRSHTRFSPPARTQHHNLRSLKVTGRSSVVGGILASLVDVPLHTLEITYLVSRVDADKSLEGLWRTHIHQLSPWTNSLLSLKIDDKRKNNDKSPIRGIPLLQPLLKFRQLQTVDFYASLYLDPDDDDYHTLAKSWPQITYLVLDFYLHRVTQRPRATIATLKTFAQHCPALTDLTLCIDINHLPKTPSVLSHPLEYLVITTRVVFNHASVARHLDAIFPELESVVALLVGHHDEPQEEDWRQDWLQVEQILQVCQQVREDVEKRE